MANPFILGQYLPQETFRGRGGALGGMGFTIANKNAAQARDAEMQADFKSVMDSKDPRQMADFSMRYPEASQQAQESFGIANEQTRGMATSGYGKALQSGNEASAAKMLNLYADQVEAAGGNPVNMRQDAAGLIDGTMSMNDLEMGVAMTEPELWGRVNKFNESKKTGKDKQLSAEALAFNDLIKDFTPKEQQLARRVKAGLKGRAVSNAIFTGIGEGTIDSYADAQAKIKQATKFAEATGASRAKLIDKGFEKLVKIDQSTRNIDKAIKVINSGAGVGVFEKMWPSITAASVELDNIRGEMALDVVGAVTFGALSKGELDLAKDVALPTGLDNDELVDYLNRKKAAQTKLRDYYYEQIQFLDQGGTVAGFLRSKESNQAQAVEQPQQQAPDAAIQMLIQNPDFAEQFKAKFGYLPEGT